ncbi:DMT family transporter [Halomicrococcus gelatinilyticus]|uniref:DMT family transporter n=1 Tax=Halomicrococcus gelatinilyticus TaxID=1702103 RepID=UPI002E0D73B7
MREYLFLGLAILSEITGTAALKLSDGFTRPLPSVVVVVGYLGAFYLLSLTLESLPIGLVYATWSAVGIVGAALLGVVVFDEGIDAAAVIGMTLIVAGVAVLNLLSDAYSPAH